MDGAGRLIRVRRLATDELSSAETVALRSLLWDAFAEDELGGFSEHDWQHALGGLHFVLEAHTEICSHASVVEREIHVDGRPVRTGYVEAVATAPAHQRRGFAAAVMREVNAYIDANFEMGALGTGSHAFYQRLGWETWLGPSYVRTNDGLERTAEEDGYIMVLRTRLSPPLDLEAPISCEWRPGDVW